MSPDGRPERLIWRLLRWPWYVQAAVASLVIYAFIPTVEPTSSLVRPLAVACFGTLAFQLGLTLPVRNVHLVSLVALMLILLAIDYGLIAYGVAVASLVVVAARASGRVVDAWPRVTEALNVGSVVMLALVTAELHGTGVVTWPTALAARQDADRDLPDVFLVMLDGYPRSDVLATRFGFDNEPFLAEMAALGFDAAPDARSNYTATALTLASMFGGGLVPDVIDEAVASLSPRAQYRELSDAINRGRALDPFRDAGYEVVTVVSPFEGIRLTSADRVLDSGGLTSFEIGLLRSGPLRQKWPDVQRSVAADTLRSRVVWSLDATSRLAREVAPRPRLIFTHVMSPHAPILFTAEGAPNELWHCFLRIARSGKTAARWGKLRRP